MNGSVVSDKKVRGFFLCWLFGLILVGVLAPLYAADNFWQKKDYHQWTLKECQQILEKSPWSNHEDIVDANVSALIRQGDVPSPRASTTISQSTSIRPDETSSGRAANNTINYIVWFTSAPAVRKAIVRERLLAVKIDQQPPDKKQQYEAQAEQFVSAQFPEVVLVHVTYRSNVANFDRELATYWQHQTLDALKNDFYLIGAHGRVAPVNFEVLPGAAREFEVTFPRTINGEPLVGPSDKDIAVEFTNPPVGGKGSSRVYMKFKVQDMVSDGKVIY
jgi:hypothetical protein